MKAFNPLTLEWEGDGFPPSARPGTRLRQILSSLGIAACDRCISLATAMDAWGPEECTRRLPEIVASMTAEADRRGWLSLVPFKRWGAAALVEEAIRGST